MRSVAALAALTLLGGCNCIFFCENGMDVQRAYVDSRNNCQYSAEKKIGLYFSEDFENQITLKERNAGLLALFSQCMHAKDWGVTAPKRDVDQSNLASVEEAQEAVQAGPQTAFERARRGQTGAATTTTTGGGYVTTTQQARPTTTPARKGPLAGIGVGPSYDETPLPPPTPVDSDF